MSRKSQVVAAALAVLLVGVAREVLYQSLAQEQGAPPTKTAPATGDNVKPDSPEVAAVRQTAEAFARAFNQGDARAVAAFWTNEGEQIGADGETIHGRAAIEKAYTEFFKNNPKARLEVQIESVRRLGRQTVLEEGRLKVQLPGAKEPSVSRYSVLHVREEDGWRMAFAREWVPDPAELVTLKDVEWLIGEWVARSEETEARITYTWDDDKAFLRGRYTLKKGSEVLSAGTQVVSKDPAGGLRSWQFDRSGSFGEWAWARDANRWVIEATGTLPDGSQVTAVNLLIPLSKDSFTWQSVERTAGGAALPDTPPVRVTRVHTGK